MATTSASSFEPRRRLSDNFRTADLAVLLGPQHGHQIRHQHPEGRGDHQTLKVAGGPSPNEDYTNWNDVWIPPLGFYCRGSIHPHAAAAKSAVGGNTRLRQEHCMIPRGGTYADIAASHYHDCVRSKFVHRLRFPAMWGCFGEEYFLANKCAIPMAH